MKFLLGLFFFANVVMADHHLVPVYCRAVGEETMVYLGSSFSSVMEMITIDTSQTEIGTEPECTYFAHVRVCLPTYRSSTEEKVVFPVAKPQVIVSAGVMHGYGYSDSRGADILDDAKISADMSLYIDVTFTAPPPRHWVICITAQTHNNIQRIEELRLWRSSASFMPGGDFSPAFFTLQCDPRLGSADVQVSAEPALGWHHTPVWYEIGARQYRSIPIHPPVGPNSR